MQAVELDFLRLSYRPDLHLLVLRWTRPVTSDEHRAGYHAALELARAEQAGGWLIDLRTRGLASPADFAWVLTEFREQLAELPAPRRLAYLVAPYHAATITARLIEQEAGLPEHVRAAAAVRIFTEEQVAQRWLHMPA
ncbi:hypothetical protein F0P96_08905 [Hymenobacter busanensis]|uniref:Uncharacterized protein n=1 Tax=Hymenobacter busanensis TaxID=2607656 RepID=A0A7L4ZZN4_9BACT|nr:hypothetical protein [Hymenobacter busanensis]KAA9333090.1 hypothetical protein F0P96_08905 [Hymenobacter busanensis]QHJ08235.1 hypothetical protein GUY19_13420 [Hymenobacter busanensis]